MSRNRQYRYKNVILMIFLLNFIYGHLKLFNFRSSLGLLIHPFDQVPSPPKPGKVEIFLFFAFSFNFIFLFFPKLESSIVKPTGF